MNDVHLTNAVLAFVSIALLLTNGVGTATQIQQDKFNYTVTFLTNVPLLVIRSYLFVIDNDPGDLHSSSGARTAFFSLLIVKEAMLIILSVIQLVFKRRRQ